MRLEGGFERRGDNQRRELEKRHQEKRNQWKAIKEGQRSEGAHAHKESDFKSQTGRGRCSSHPDLRFRGRNWRRGDREIEARGRGESQPRNRRPGSAGEGARGQSNGPIVQFGKAHERKGKNYDFELEAAQNERGGGGGSGKDLGIRGAYVGPKMEKQGRNKLGQKKTSIPLHRRAFEGRFKEGR